MYRVAALLAAFGVPVFAVAADDLFDGFAAGWRGRWQEERFLTKPTRYTVVTESTANQPSLHAVSEAAHAGLVRRITVTAPTTAQLTWRWKIAAPLTGNTRERTRAGDDYAARVFVVFEPSALPLRTRALNYVWSAHEPVGAAFASPYTSNVAMIVVRSGAAEAGRWLAESRDVLADYHAYFGTPPREICAVAVLVDTDNTGRSAEAWFSELRLATTPPQVASERPAP